MDKAERHEQAKDLALAYVIGRCNALTKHGVTIESAGAEGAFRLSYVRTLETRVDALVFAEKLVDAIQHAKREP